MILEFKFNSQRFCLFAIYRLHSFSKDDFLVEINEYFLCNNNFKTKKNALFIGDANLNLFENSMIIDNYNAFLYSNGFDCLLKEPTRVTTESVSCIDHVFARLANKVKTQVDVKVIDANITDHRMAVVCVRVVVGGGGVEGQTSADSAGPSPPSYRVDYDGLLARLEQVKWVEVYDDKNPINGHRSNMNELQHVLITCIYNILIVTETNLILGINHNEWVD
ncbi:hypothetical protein J6590_095697 [Homalodisca vitripennis]|nr:hypothetical protein J6590_095697 [Homalodisca vitripennis]